MDVVSPLRSRIRRLHRHSESEESPENSPSSRPLSATRGSPDRLLGYSDQQSDIIETRLDGQQEKSLSTLGVLSRDNIAMQGHFFRTIVGSSMDSSRKLSTRGGGFRSVILGEKAAETEVERFYQLSIAETERFRKAAEAEVSRFASENAQLRREIKEMVPQQHLAAAQMTIARLTMDARSLAAQLKEADARAAAAAKETELMRAQTASAVRAQRQQEAAAADLRRRCATLVCRCASHGCSNSPRPTAAHLACAAPRPAAVLCFFPSQCCSSPGQSSGWPGQGRSGARTRTPASAPRAET